MSPALGTLSLQHLWDIYENTLNRQLDTLV